MRIIKSLFFSMVLVVTGASALGEPRLVFSGEKSGGVYVDAPGGNEQTFACWFKALGCGEGDKPFDRIVQTPTWYLHTRASETEVGGITFGYTGANGKIVSMGIDETEPMFGMWQHLAVVYSKDGFRFYLNGIEQVIVDDKSNIPNEMKPGRACIGNIVPGASRPFKGCMDGVRFWPQVLDAKEIARLAAKDPDGNPPKIMPSAGPSGSDILPVVDISKDTWRQVVIAEGAKDRYEGHPTTLLADDGITMFCVWTTGHGGPCGQMARSDDGGRTWKRMDTTLPEVYGRTHRNCPVLQKLKGPDGKVRYFVYSAKAREGRGLGILMSEDCGATWQELPFQPQLSSGMPPTGVMELKNGNIALFGQVFRSRDKAKDRPSDDQAIWMAISKDGGKSYGKMRHVMMAEKRNLCEPCCLRSPDGKSLILIARENRHRGRSMMSFSDDEGVNWTIPVDTPWALTGDRHEGVLLPDGRYVIAFRDQAVGSPTRGQFMAWVGTFDDLRNGRNGQCRIHLLKHHGKPNVFPGGLWDTGYPGMELLNDGTIVATTYSRHFDDDRQSSVVCTRFKISEIDSQLPMDYPIRAAEMSCTKITGGFWFDRMETNRTMTLRANLAKCNETPRIANFTNAANHAWGKFGGIPFDDSDVFKVMEGAAYILAAHPDKELEDYVDWFIGQVAKAQEPDGYLYTARTLGHTYRNKDGSMHFGMMGPTRWSRCSHSHELYNVGHMYEAAVAWQTVTGKRNFLEIAQKNAELIFRTFGPHEYQLKDVPGHEEIELALVKLYRATGVRRYLELAKHFVSIRGVSNSDRQTMNVFTTEGTIEVSDEMAAPGAYCQKHRPIIEQSEAVGHAVRAAYLYCGVADIAALTGEKSYVEAIERIWNNVVSCKLHLTGGIGARKKGEAFGANYELPNETAYLETCAAIGNALWNQRMFLSRGEAKYVDVLERILYNGFLSGISLSGDEFFYPNPLASKGGYKRSKWFGCSCCPVNDVRFIPQIPSFIYATDGKSIYVNLFAESTTEINGFKLAMHTDYPWNGKIRIEVSPDKEGRRCAIKVRVPGWARGKPVPSDLYAQTEPADFGASDAYKVFERDWKKGDFIDMEFPMPVKRIQAHAKVEADRGRLAVERGPIVYCAEGVDNDGKAFDVELPAEVTFTEDTVCIGDKTFPALRASNGVKLIPYCLWGNREPGNEMQVWFR